LVRFSNWIFLTDKLQQMEINLYWKDLSYNSLADFLITWL
jgi:hypothetical protein